MISRKMSLFLRNRLDEIYINYTYKSMLFSFLLPMPKLRPGRRLHEVGCRPGIGPASAGNTKQDAGT